MNDHTMRQIAPYPTILAELVKAVAYKPDWEFELRNIRRDHVPNAGDSFGLTLDITITCEDAYHPTVMRRVKHYFAVPPATYDMRSWRRWLFERILDVERHEAMEHFRFNEDQDFEGARPYAPSHGPGNDPYLVREVGTEVDQRTSFRGEVKR